MWISYIYTPLRTRDCQKLGESENERKREREILTLAKSYSRTCIPSFSIFCANVTGAARETHVGNGFLPTVHSHALLMLCTE